MNKCRRRIAQEDYIMGNIFHKRGGRKIEKGEREQSALHWYFVLQTHIGNYLLGRRNLIHQGRSSSILAVIQFINTWFFNPLSTNLLYWVHRANVSYLLGLGFKLWSYIDIYIYIYIYLTKCYLINFTKFHLMVKLFNAPSRLYILFSNIKVSLTCVGLANEISHLYVRKGGCSLRDLPNNFSAMIVIVICM